VPCSVEEAQFHDARDGREETIWQWTQEVEATPEVITYESALSKASSGFQVLMLQETITGYCDNQSSKYNSSN